MPESESATKLYILDVESANHALRAWIKRLDEALVVAQKRSDELAEILNDIDTNRAAVVAKIKADVLEEIRETSFYLNYR
ncbi:MAG: hypothetical protein IID41_15720 [Planctomycetes bacterium]|nr:hypothetical protein [Planctomycetota bacterium]